MGRLWQRTYHDSSTGRNSRQPGGDLRTQAARYLVPHDTAANRPADDEADSGTDQCRFLQEVNHQAANTGPATATRHGREVRRGSKAVRSRQHGIGSGYADSSLRPLRRRADRMARPARVRIRSRKPWVFARRRLFGWKVRLLTVSLHHNQVIGAGTAPPAWVSQKVGTAQAVPPEGWAAHEDSTVRIAPS